MILFGLPFIHYLRFGSDLFVSLGSILEQDWLVWILVYDGVCMDFDYWISLRMEEGRSGLGVTDTEESGSNEADA